MTTPTYDERRFVELAQAGDASAFAQVVAARAETLWRCARAICRDDHEAEDLAQETFVEAWRSLGRFDFRCRCSTWLYGILRNRFLKAHRKPRPVTNDAAARAERQSDAVPPNDQLEKNEDAARLRAVVERLPEEHRPVIELRFFAAASLDDIAALLDLPLGTVKSRLHHGLEKLRRANLQVNLFPRDRESSV